LDWREDGTILSLRPHGETSVILEVFTRARGRHAGVVRGGVSRKIAPVIQPGNRVTLAWRARLEDHLGSFTAEPLISRAGILSDRLALSGLNAICALLMFVLPERDPHPALHDRTEELLGQLAAGHPDWPLAYLRWEMQLLEEMGHGLDLSRCAVTGSREDLAFVSPKTGRAVSRGAAGDWAPRLLPLPQCLLGQGPAMAGELGQGLAVTGHFLATHLAPALGTRPLPEARNRLIAALSRQQL
jgi:DNA repair protein RecO (recombination protein O)